LAYASPLSGSVHETRSSVELVVTNDHADRFRLRDTRVNSADISGDVCQDVHPPQTLLHWTKVSERSRKRHRYGLSAGSVLGTQAIQTLVRLQTFGCPLKARENRFGETPTN
jgi:hypothetical protein